MKFLKTTFLITLLILILSFPSNARAQDETPVSNEITFEITGAIINKTSDLNVQESMEVMLHVWDKHGNQTVMVHGQSLEDGTFSFPDVPLDINYNYSTMAIFENGSYYSESISVGENTNNLEINVYVYDFTSEISNLSISGLHILFHEDDGDLAVLELFVVDNSGFETVRNAITLEDGSQVTLVYPVPTNASDLIFNDEDRYIETKDGFADTASYIPGEEGALVETSFSLAYENNILFSLEMPLNTDNVYIYIAENSGIEIENNIYPSSGTSLLRDGTEVEIFEIPGLEMGETLNISLTGELKGKPEPTLISSAPEKDSWLSTYGISVGGIILGIAFISTGIWWWRANNDEDIIYNNVEKLDLIVSEIVQLDIKNMQGEIEKEEYNRRREDLLIKAKEVKE